MTPARLVSLLGGALLVAGCSGPASAPPRPPFEGARSVRPSLEEVFLEPPISGEAPVIESISPDGRFVLVRWDEPEEAGDADAPQEEPRRGRPERRLLALDDPAATGHRGVPVASLLPAPPAVVAPDVDGEEDPPNELGPCVWSHRGHLLAAGRGADVWLIDPGSGEVTHFFRAEEVVAGKKEKEEEGAAQRDGDDRPEKRVLYEEVRSLAFAPDDRSLRLADARELYSLPLDPAALPAEPHGLEEARWWSEAIDPPALRVRWSVDLKVAFGESPTPKMREEREGGGEGEREREGERESEGEPEAGEPLPQVWRLEEERGVVLAGMADEEWLERMAISPDGRWVAGVAYDRSREPAKTLIPDYLTERVTTREARRLLADDVASPFELSVWSTDRGDRRRMLPEDGPHTGLPEAPANGDGDAGGDASSEEATNPGAPYRVRTIGWAPQPDPGSPARFAFELWSADFRELGVWCWTEGFCERLWHERDEAWVGGPARTTAWTADGRWLIVGSESPVSSGDSTTPGRAQLFALDPDALTVTQLTEVEGEVKAFRALKGGGVLLEASRRDLARRWVGLLPPDALAADAPFDERVRWYPAPPGSPRRAAGARGGERVVFQHERLLEPGELWAATPERSWQLTRTTPAAFHEVDWIRPERLALPSPDGRTVWAHVFLPPGTSLAPVPPHRARPRATVVFVHGAGYLQNVTDSMTRYPLNLMFHSRLARLGYPVIDVDYRGSAGYGRDFRTDVQYHLGGKDLDDIHLVVDELVARGLVDRERVGLYGGSYGGFLTLMALFTAPERWRAGAALRSVTDWRTYHPWYTQPRLGRPSTHPEAYERSSPIDHVANLADPLLVLHGLVDSNVFAQDSVRLIEELIDLGKEFDAMLYPSQGHAFADGEHWLDEYRRIERFVVEHLGPPLPR